MLPPTRAYCTYFDSAYLTRGTALIESLRAVGDEGECWILALDEATSHNLRHLSVAGIQVVRLEDLEHAYPALLTVRDQRAGMDYIFTLTPWLVSFVMSSRPEVEWVTYLDADMYFFSGTEEVYRELERGSVGIVSHRFPTSQQWRVKFGNYNVAWVSFRNDPDGLRTLEWWGLRCLEWCSDVPDDGKFGDQGYLDGFAAVSDRTVVLSHPGVDVAPWNLPTHTVSTNGAGDVYVDDRPLVLFHFHGLKKHRGRYYFKHLPYRARTTSAIRDHIYTPYCAALERAESATPSTQARMFLPRRLGFLPSLSMGRGAVLRVLGRIRGDSIKAPR